MKCNRIALALLLAPLTAAVQAEVTFTPMASYHFFDGSKATEDHEGYALALGYRFTPAIALELHHGRTQTQLEVGGKVTDSRSSLDAYYAFNADSRFSPYLLLGAGEGRYKAVAPGANSQDTIINGAVGAFFRFNDNVALRGEIRNVFNSDYDVNDQLALLGLEFSAANAQAFTPSAPAPEPEPAPVEELAAAPADTDGDGVADDVDQCPDTPAGTAVNEYGCTLDGDADGDGVADSLDRCPNTLAGVAVGKNGCPLDADKDGVPDYLDKCADTPAGVAVDAAGCTVVLTEAINKKLSVTFDSGAAVVKDEYKAEIGEVATLLKQYPGTSAEIQGHTDSSGKAASNDKLSQQRADAVKAVLVNEFGADASRVTAQGYGSSQPVADNKTVEGRAQNRRVIAIISGEAKKVQMKKK
ncbi:MAG: OmpA family protein [Moraxellaceae bacterium]|nr:OmpA family protein [Moraxellaceae bacterium]